MFRIFKSTEQKENYFRCLSNIEIGDKVEFLIDAGSPVSLNKIIKDREFFPFTKYKKLLAPIVGKSPLFQSYGFNISVVGISYADHWKFPSAYEPNSYHSKMYSIIPNFEGYIYTNSGLDIVYSKIIKKKNSNV